MRFKHNLVLEASATSVDGRSFEGTGLTDCYSTVQLSVSAATLSAALQFCATCLSPDVSIWPANTKVSVVTELPTGITFNAADGTLTFANPAIGDHEVTLRHDALPMWSRCSYTYTSGGGVVSVSVVTAGWG